MENFSDLRQMLKAFDKTKEYFTRSAFLKFRTAYQVGALPLAVEQTFEKLSLRQYQEIVRPPKTIDHYFEKTGHIFSKKFSSQFKENCREIDRIFGDPLSDDFFASQSILEWTQILVANTINSKLLPALVDSSSSPDLKGSSDSQSHSSLEDELKSPPREASGGRGDAPRLQRSNTRKLAKRCFQEPKLAVSRAFSHVRSALPSSSG